MKARIISGIIGLSLLIAIVMMGGNILNISILALSLIGLYEFHKAIRQIESINPISYLNYIFAISIFLTNYITNMTIDFVMFIYIILVLSALVFNSKSSFKDVTATLFGGLYIAFFFYHIYLLSGSIYIWIVFIAAFATDTFAYFSGVLLGKHKLCPTISPKKTIEGSVGGIMGCLITIIVFCMYFEVDNIMRISILSIVLSVMSQIGDLTASKIKRTANIKDYGNLMPGHGGVLDRFDSILFTAPIVYYYMTYLI